MQDFYAGRKYTYGTDDTSYYTNDISDSFNMVVVMVWHLTRTYFFFFYIEYNSNNQPLILHAFSLLCSFLHSVFPSLHFTSSPVENLVSVARF